MQQWVSDTALSLSPARPGDLPPGHCDSVIVRDNVSRKESALLSFRFVSPHNQSLPVHRPDPKHNGL